MSDVHGWVTKSLGEIAHIVMGQSPDSKYYSEEEIGMPFLQGCAEFGPRLPTPKWFCSHGKKVAPAGSILFSVRAPVGTLNTADREYIIGRGLAAIVGTSLDQSYLEQYLRFEEPRFRRATQGSTFEAINSAELANWPVQHPGNSAEQAWISKVLSSVDEAIERITALIAKQRRITTGLLQDLLTNGLDESGNLRTEQTHEFKDSPMGCVPAEWEVTQLGRVSDFVTSGARGWARYYAEDGATFLRIGNLTRDHIDLRLNDLVFVRPPASAEGRRTAVRAGDLLVSVTADLGIIGVIPNDFGEGFINQHIALVRLDQAQVCSRFIGWFLTSRGGQTQFERFNEPGAKAGLNLPTVRSLLVPKPGYEEQERVAGVIDASLAAVNAHTCARHKLLALKAGLMRDLLTGARGVDRLLSPREVSAG